MIKEPILLYEADFQAKRQISSATRVYKTILKWQKALKINPNNSKAWNNKGSLIDELGKDDEAIHCYDRALVVEFLLHLKLSGIYEPRIRKVR